MRWRRFGPAMASSSTSDRWTSRACSGVSAPCTLEIGFGNGEHLLERALADPERDFLGVEVHRPGVGHLLLAAGKAGITNLRVIAHDAVDVLQHQIPQTSLDEVQLLFPGPLAQGTPP